MARNYTIKIFLLYCAVFVFLSCGASRKVIVRKENKSVSTQSVPAEKVPEKQKVKVKKPKNKLSSEERANLYIATYAEIAVSEMKKHEIPCPSQPHEHLQIFHVGNEYTLSGVPTRVFLSALPFSQL